MVLLVSNDVGFVDNRLGTSFIKSEETLSDLQHLDWYLFICVSGLGFGLGATFLLLMLLLDALLNFCFSLIDSKNRSQLLDGAHFLGRDLIRSSMLR